MPMNDTASNRFKFELSGERFRGSKFELSIQQVNVPGMTIGTVLQPTPIKDIWRPGDSVEHNELAITFFVTEEYEEWIEIFDWLTDMVSPSEISRKEIFADAHLTILSNKFNPIFSLKFFNLFPYSLTDIPLMLDIDNPIALTATVMFRYHDIKKISNL